MKTPEGHRDHRFRTICVCLAVTLASGIFGLFVAPMAIGLAAIRTRLAAPIAVELLALIVAQSFVILIATALATTALVLLRRALDGKANPCGCNPPNDSGLTPCRPPDMKA